MIIAYVNLKGGVGKTTSAVMTAQALHAQGSTLLIDADPQGSALSWNEKADLDFPVISLPSKTLHREVAKTHAANYDHIVIDTPPGNLAIVGSALHAADEVIVPIQPTAADVDQLAETLETIEEIQDVRDNGLPALHILMTRVLKSAKASDQLFELLSSMSLPALPIEIPQRQWVAGLHGSPMKDDLNGYDEVVARIEKRRAKRGVN